MVLTLKPFSLMRNVARVGKTGSKEARAAEIAACRPCDKVSLGFCLDLNV